MLKYMTVAAMLAIFAFAPISQAQTPDGQTPAEESVCDDLEGALYGLCVAFCEAMDCDTRDDWALDRACNRVLTNYMKHNPEDFPPCLDPQDDDDDDDHIPPEH